MITIRHDRLLREDNTWSTASEFMGIRVRFKTGIIDIPLCTQEQPRLGCYSMSKRSEGWIICPSIYTKDLGKWLTRGQSYSTYSPYEFLCAVNADSIAYKYMESI